MSWSTLHSISKTKRARSAFVLIVLAAILFFGRDHMHFIGEGWRELDKANNTYILIASVMVALSMVAQAEVMVVLLRSAGVRVKRGTANVLGLAANSWSSTFPGGPALSAAMIFREQLKWGATPVIASWYMVLSGALAGAGMALLALGAVFFHGLDVKPLTLTLSILGLVALAAGMNWVASHPRQVENWLIGRARAYNRWRKAPEDRFTDNIRGFGKQLSAVKLPLPKLGLAMFHSLMNWVLEILCLLACIAAVGSEPAVAGVVLSFLAAKLVGQAPITPGGLGTVDVALTTSLVGIGTMTSVQAFAAVIVFRMLSFIGLTIVGWIVYFGAKLAKPVVDSGPQPPHQSTRVGVEKETDQ